MTNTSTRYQEAQNLYDNGSFREALKIFKELADDGNSGAQCQTGYIYFGYCDKNLRNNKEAFRYTKMAAEQGHSAATSNMGYCFNEGVGCKQDLYMGAYYYRRAIELGYNDAHNNYGWALENRKGVNKSLSGAMRNYRIAANCGNDNAVNNIKKLESKFNFDTNDNIDVKASEIGKWQRIFLLILLAIAFFIFEFAIDNDEPIALGVIFSHWVTSLCIALILLELKIGGWLFKYVAPIAIVVINSLNIINVIKTDTSVDAVEVTAVYLTAFVSWVLTYLIMQIKNNGVPYWNTIMEIPFDGDNFFRRNLSRYLNYGYGDEYLENSAQTAKFREFFNMLTIAIAAFSIANIVVIFISDGYINFHLEWNFFNSWSAGILYAIGLILTLTQSLSIFQTWIVSKDKYGNETSRKRSNDMTDAVSDGFLMPLIQRFIAYPLGIAIPVYYIIVFALSLFEPIMPYLFIIIFALIAINYLRKFTEISRRLNRRYAASLLAGCSMLIIVLLSTLWLFFSVNRFTPQFGTPPAKREYNEMIKRNHTSEVENPISTQQYDIRNSLECAIIIHRV